MALREAEKLGPRSVEFYDTVDDLIAVLKQTGSSFEDILEVLERQTAAVESLYSSSPRNKAFNLYRLATYFNDLSKHDRSADLLTESLRIFDHLMQSGDLTISLMEVSGAAHNLGFNLGELRRFEEAEKLFRRSLEIKEQYLGKDHPDQQYSLDYLMRCLHHLGNHDEEAAVRHRLSKLTSGDDYDPHKTHGPSCPWYLSECPA
jgi:tetratricopeptide (TPR) repeat protein